MGEEIRIDKLDRDQGEIKNKNKKIIMALIRTVEETLDFLLFIIIIIVTQTIKQKQGRIYSL